MLIHPVGDGCIYISLIYINVPSKHRIISILWVHYSPSIPFLCCNTTINICNMCVPMHRMCLLMSWLLKIKIFASIPNAGLSIIIRYRFVIPMFAGDICWYAPFIFINDVSLKPMPWSLLPASYCHMWGQYDQLLLNSASPNHLHWVGLKDFLQNITVFPSNQLNFYKVSLVGPFTSPKK